VRDARDLLLAAEQIYDEPANGLQAAARAATWRAFGGSAAWMRSAMAIVRGHLPGGKPSPEWLGAFKYAIAVVAASLVGALLWRLPLLALPAAVVTFYFVEVRMVFVFPLALDGEPAPFVASHRLVARTLPAGLATVRVMRIAARMLFGGFMGRGFVRSWCVGCLAVVLWYEDARQSLSVQA
jgi:hypothetical protein